MRQLLPGLVSEAQLMREMMRQSAQVADLGLADYFITDRQPPPALRHTFDDTRTVALCPAANAAFG